MRDALTNLATWGTLAATLFLAPGPRSVQAQAEGNPSTPRLNQNYDKAAKENVLIIRRYQRGDTNVTPEECDTADLFFRWPDKNPDITQQDAILAKGREIIIGYAATIVGQEHTMQPEKPDAVRKRAEEKLATTYCVNLTAK